MGDLPPISWASLGVIILCATTVGGAIIAVLMWIYRELGTLRSELMNFRIESSRQYVTTTALQDVEARVERSVIKLGDRLDRSIENLLNMLRADAVERAKLSKID